MEVGVDALTQIIVLQQDEVPVYVDDLPSDIGPGTCITVEGLIKSDCSRFVPFINYIQQLRYLCQTDVTVSYY